jgi:hypothetical protein
VPDDGSLPDHLDEGAALYREGDYFEAHEVWEQAWHDADGTDRTFLHGLIQLAAAYVNLERGNPEGVERLSERALERLDGVPDRYRGVDVAAVRRQLRENAERARDAVTDDRVLVLRRPTLVVED